MNFETRFTWEKLLLELKALRMEDFGNLVPLCVGIQSALWPKENIETCTRAIQFMGFEMQKACEGKDEAERWSTLREFLFENKGFQISSARPADVSLNQILLREVVQERIGHPLPVVFLILHLTHLLEIPLSLIHARHHFLIKWVRSGKTTYLDLYNEARALNDQEMVKVLNRSGSNLEVWTAPQLITQYLELLRIQFERTQSLSQLHTVYNLLLQMDEANVVALGQRALLRQRMGFEREALNDLKRYFSFVERAHAPSELTQAYLRLENITEAPGPRGPADLLH